LKETSPHDNLSPWVQGREGGAWPRHSSCRQPWVAPAQPVNPSAMRARLRVGRSLMSALFSAIGFLGCRGDVVARANADAASDVSDATDVSDAAQAQAPSCVIAASNYDRSCTQDSDCFGYIYGANSDAGQLLGDLPSDWGAVLPVQFGDYCADAVPCVCGGDAINGNAIQKYVSDVSKTPLVLGYASDNACFCPVVVFPPDGGGGVGTCCVDGTCSAGVCPSH
jgi:hypothetical protein